MDDDKPLFNAGEALEYAQLVRQRLVFGFVVLAVAALVMVDVALSMPLLHILAHVLVIGGFGTVIIVVGTDAGLASKVFRRTTHDAWVRACIVRLVVGPVTAGLKVGALVGAFVSLIFAIRAIYATLAQIGVVVMAATVAAAGGWVGTAAAVAWAGRAAAEEARTIPEADTAAMEGAVAVLLRKGIIE